MAGLEFTIRHFRSDVFPINTNVTPVRMRECLDNFFVTCGPVLVNAFGKVSVFVAGRILRTFQWRMPNWLADR